MVFTRFPTESSFPVSRALRGTCQRLSRFCNILLQALTLHHVKITRSTKLLSVCRRKFRQIIDLFKHCKLQPHTCKLSQYTLATRLRFGNSGFYSITWRMRSGSASYKIYFRKQPLFRRNLCPLSVWYLSFLFVLLGNRPFPHSCKQRFRVEAWVDKVQWFVYDIVHPRLVLIFLFAHWSGMPERSIRLFGSRVFTQSNKLVTVDTTAAPALYIVSQ